MDFVCGNPGYNKEMLQPLKLGANQCSLQFLIRGQFINVLNDLDELINLIPLTIVYRCLKHDLMFVAATILDPNLCTKLSASFSQASDVVSWLAAPF